MPAKCLAPALVIALVMALAPGFAHAMRCNHGPQKMQTMSCADGMVFDSAAGTCVAAPAS